MKSNWKVYSLPPHAYLRWSKSGWKLFETVQWASVTRSLSAKPLYAWNESRQQGVVIARFKKFGLKVGVLGFPVADPELNASGYEQIASMAKELAQLARLDIMRVNCIGGQQVDDRFTAARPEVWLDGLGPDLVLSKKARKDIAYARKHSKQILINESCVFADECYSLYASTVRANDGSLKYTPEYFYSLARLSQECENLVFLTATHDGNVVGFAVLAMQDQIAYYLHASASEAGRKRGVSDLLLERLIRIAAERGCTTMSLMASPWDQPGLIKFKTKWGNRNAFAVTYDFKGSVMGGLAILAARWGGRHDRVKTLNAINMNAIRISG